MEILKKFLSYIRWKKEKGVEKNLNLRLMHGINKISILMFIIAMIILVTKCT